MVKFGYVENVDEMHERLKYDILYIENMSLLIDLKIMIHTVLIYRKAEARYLLFFFQLLIFQFAQKGFLANNFLYANA